MASTEGTTVEDQEVMVIMASTMDSMVTVEGLEVMEIVEGLEVMETVEGLEVMGAAMEVTTMGTMDSIMEIMVIIMESKIFFKIILLIVYCC